VKRFDYVEGYIDGVNKPCSKCGELKPLTEFYRDSSQKYNRHRIRSECKLCGIYRLRKSERKLIKQRHMLRKYYGLTLDGYADKLLAQGGVCAICGLPETAVSGKGRALRRLAVDHNHVTMEVRDLLCSRCNQALGIFELHPELIAKFVAYLKKWGCLNA
jgi:hypothetical protein